MWKEHVDIILRYTRWFAQERKDPGSILSACREAPDPHRRFLELAGRIPGYEEDPLRKKLLLLAVILENRPERFLPAAPQDAGAPIIDYHLQRSALRTGLVTITDPELATWLAARRVVMPEQESAVRNATYEAMEGVLAQSGISAAALDYFFFSNRTRCPEMTEPDCPACPVQGICRRRVDLFQPVYRTTAY
jgi:hypothetical protein